MQILKVIIDLYTTQTQADIQAKWQIKKMNICREFRTENMLAK